MKDKKYTHDILQLAKFGIDENISADETVEVSLRDLVFVAQTLQEFVRYFHNRNRYPTIEDVHEYMGSANEGGAFNLLRKANYEVMGRMLPKTMDDLYDEGVFDAPVSPFYFKAKD